jgi:hypothetical protein
MKRTHPRAIEIEAYVWSTPANPVDAQRPGRSRRLVRRVWISILEVLRIRQSNGSSRIPS